MKYPVSFDAKDAKDRNWPHLMWFTQFALPGTTVDWSGSEARRR